MTSPTQDPEGPSQANRIPAWRLVFDQAGITPQVANHPYPGDGTEESPYLVSWIPDDPRNPMLFSNVRKWGFTMMLAFATLAVALVSSAYTGGMVEIMHEFEISEIVATLGVSLFVLGFAIGPLLWAPMSEIFGRQILFIVSYAGLTAFNAGAAGAKNTETLLVLRFFAGAFGSSPLTNAGGVIADMFSASERGLAMALFASAPFMGPVMGPVIGGFLGMNAGWRWVLGFLATFSGALWIITSFIVPETYAPVLLRRRAAVLSRQTGKFYISQMDHAQGRMTLSKSIKQALVRPWVLLFREPIVFIISVYMAIIYGTLYMLFAAYPIVYQQDRGWNQGVGGLPFVSLAIGILLAVAFTVYSNKRYVRIVIEHGGIAPPEARLLPCLVGSVALPIGLFWFAWTNGPNIHWMASVASGVPFGFSMVLVFLSLMNYLVDSYTIFAASVLAANAVLRSLFGAVFPLFTSYMYKNLGIHWASTIPAFLALACMPFPFLFYKYGAAIRKRGKFAAQSSAFMARLQQGAAAAPAAASAEEEETEQTIVEKSTETVGSKVRKSSDHEWPEHPSSVDGTDDSGSTEEQPTYAPVTATHSRMSARDSLALSRTRSYEGNPYNVDQLNTRRSFSKD